MNKVSYFFFVAFVSVFLSNCSSSEQPPIRLGVNVWPGYEYLFLARDQGYFDDEGLNIQLVETASLDDLRRAYERGKIDGMASSTIEVIQAAANSGRIAKIFMIPDFSNGADVIIADRSMSSPALLKGKRIGMEVSSLGQFMVARALQLHGLSLQDIVIVPMSQEEMNRGMYTNQVDAVMTYPPVSINLLRDATHKVIFSSAEIPGEVMDVISLSPEVLHGYPDVPKKILRAWQKALTFAKENPEYAYTLAGERVGISAKEFASALEGVKLLSLSEQRELFQKENFIERALQLVENIALTKEQKKKIPPLTNFIYDRSLMDVEE